MKSYLFGTVKVYKNKKTPFPTLLYGSFAFFVTIISLPLFFCFGNFTEILIWYE